MVTTHTHYQQENLCWKDTLREAFREGLKIEENFAAAMYDDYVDNDEVEVKKRKTFSSVKDPWAPYSANNIDIRSFVFVFLLETSSWDVILCCACLLACFALPKPIVNRSTLFLFLFAV